MVWKWSFTCTYANVDQVIMSSISHPGGIEKKINQLTLAQVLTQSEFDTTDLA